MDNILKKLSTENEAQYIYRIGQAKDNNLITDSWDIISPILNQELGYDEEQAAKYDIRPGVGIAAPQIDVLKNMFVINDIVLVDDITLFYFRNYLGIIYLF